MTATRALNIKVCSVNFPQSFDRLMSTIFVSFLLLNHVEKETVKEKFLETDLYKI